MSKPWPKGVIGIRPHSMTARVLHWPCCRHCGLVALKNKRTKEALRRGCYKWKDEE